jgi:hypothetical protein
VVAVSSLVIMVGGEWVRRRITNWGQDERAFLLAEHAAWPKPTPAPALSTRSPDGRYVTSSNKHAVAFGVGEDRADYLNVAMAKCPGAVQEITHQDHADCESDWLGCNHGDGELRHEHYGLRVRWVDTSHLEASWTELAGLDPAGHRRWHRMKESIILSTEKAGDENVPFACGADALTWDAAEVIPASK